MGCGREVSTKSWNPQGGVVSTRVHSDRERQRVKGRDPPGHLEEDPVAKPVSAAQTLCVPWRPLISQALGSLVSQELSKQPYSTPATDSDRAGLMQGHTNGSHQSMPCAGSHLSCREARGARRCFCSTVSFIGNQCHKMALQLCVRVCACIWTPGPFQKPTSTSRTGTASWGVGV